MINQTCLCKGEELGMLKDCGLLVRFQGMLGNLVFFWKKGTNQEVEMIDQVALFGADESKKKI